ncbi:MAG: translation initiation factor IF-2 [Candidatus Aminicenantes bacterium]|nr:translation initiation factor IF-2 [Candidatus Aminicenantes bacterium]
MTETKIIKTTKTTKDGPKARPVILLREGSTVKELAAKLKARPKDILEKLAAKGFSLSVNDVIDEAFAAKVAATLGIVLESVSVEKEMRKLAESKKADLVTRPPVVTIMGHVDHGKTTLLDAIRSSNLVDKESGGITQHIGAYQVVHNKRPITFIDTPGHEAFTQLRARGAKVTDIVVLVIAADEAVMPQTKEAISHAKAAGVPMIVAINKIDKPEANPDKIKRELQKENVLVEEWGGDVISVAVSAKDKKNIKELLEMILLLADVIEIKANPKGKAQGFVLEARLDAKKGPLATVIIQNGTLSVGQAFLSGTTFGKVRALNDEHGRGLKAAGPSTPVEILGFSGVPQAGDFFLVLDSQEEARAVAEYRLSRASKGAAQKPGQVTLDDLFKKIEAGESKELPIILKADVQGSVEVLTGLLPSLGTEKVKIRIIQAMTGSITESDILLASTSKAIILGYNVKPGPKIQDLAQKENVQVLSYKIIYQLTDDIKKAVAGMLEPVIKETYLGRAQVRKIFRIPKVGVIAGSYVQDGKIVRNAEVKVLRNKEVVFKGRIASLKHLKENVTEVKKDLECGIGLDRFKEFQEGDLIEAFITEKVYQS